MAAMAATRRSFVTVDLPRVAIGSCGVDFAMAGAGLEGDPHSARRGVAGKRPSLRCLCARLNNFMVVALLLPAFTPVILISFRRRQRRLQRSQDAAEQIVIARGDMPTACRALEAWAALAGLQPRQACSARSISMATSARRLTGHSVSAIAQTRMRRLEHRRGKTHKDAKATAADQRPLAARRLRDQRGCQGAAELPHSGAHSRRIRGYSAGLHPRKRPVGKSGLKGLGFTSRPPLAIVSKRCRSR